MYQYRMYLGSDRGPGTIPVTDNEFEEFLKAFVNKWFKGYSVFIADGHWEGTNELTRVLEIIADGNMFSTVLSVADAYKNLFEQESVLVTSIGVRSAFV